eukprot:jgi/Tetstr1/458157/TSEL_044648.t1
MAPQVETLVFDLDGTLYGIENGYEAHVRQNVFAFMHEKLDVEKEKCESIWRAAFKKHNQTLKGLRSEGFEFDREEFWDFIRAGREQFLGPHPQVGAMLAALPQDKWVLTNCNEKHAKLALQTMGIESHFKGVIGADFMDPLAKPQEEAFKRALDFMGASAKTTWMFEDSVKNLRSCKQMGMTTVLVTGLTTAEEGASADALLQEGTVDYVVSDCSEAEIRAKIPALFAAP